MCFYEWFVRFFFQKFLFLTIEFASWVGFGLVFLVCFGGVFWFVGLQGFSLFCFRLWGFC